MLNDVTFGQYYPANSLVHKIDSRVKILLTVLYIVVIFLVKNFWGFIAVGAFIVLCVLCSKVPFRSLLRSVRAILFLLVFTAILNILFFTGGTVLWQWWIIKITDSALYFTAFMALRLFLLVLGTALLTLTTTPVDLTAGIESLLSPLKLLRFPVHELALIMSIALRFIPTLIEETDRIIRAQKARGGDFESGGLIKRARALIPILIPLLISSFKRADDLAEAMDARCYNGGKGRTRYKKIKFSFRDALGIIFGGALLAGVILLNIYFAAIL